MRFFILEQGSKTVSLCINPDFNCSRPSASKSNPSLCTTCKSNSWQKANRSKVNEARRDYFRERRHFDPQYRMRKNIQVTTSQALRRPDSLNEVKYVGCSNVELKQHIESQFSPEMSWNNYGTFWEIDHIKGLREFDLLDPVQVEAAAHFINIRPLKRLENRQRRFKKSND